MIVSSLMSRLSQGLTVPSAHRARVPCFRRVLSPHGASSSSSSSSARDGIARANVKTYELCGHGIAGGCSILAGEKHKVQTDLPKRMGGKDEAPQPVELLVSALIGCEQATAAFVARHMKPRMALRGLTFRYNAVRDDRGATSLPLDVHPPISARLQEVSGTVIVHLEDKTKTETKERVEELKRHVEMRCPVANTLASAGCELNIDWILAEPGTVFENF